MTEMLSGSRADFLERYDNGSGFDWRFDLGGDWAGDWGFGPNTAGNGKIYPAEVKEAGGLEQMAADWQRLSAEDQRVVAPMFKGRLVSKLIARLGADDARGYAAFKEKFDDGTGCSDSEGDDWFGVGEINAGGGLLLFQTELQKLPEAVQLIVRERLTPEVKKLLLENSPEKLFWGTFDNGKGIGASKGDGLLAAKEIKHVGWDSFLQNFELLSDEEAIHVLDHLVDLPPNDGDERVLFEIGRRFPDYVRFSNLKQFPRVAGAPFSKVRKGLEMIKEVSGLQIAELGPNSLPPFRYALPVNAAEQFYVDLLQEMRRFGLTDRMSVEAFAQFVEKHGDQVPRVDIRGLKRAISGDESRYIGKTFSMDVRTFPFGAVGDVTRTGTLNEMEVDSSPENEAFIQKLKKVMKWEKRSTGFVFFNPEMKADYHLLVCDSTGRLFDQDGCVPMHFSRRFYRYEVDALEERVMENRFSEERLMRALQEPERIEAKPVKVDNIFNLTFANLFYKVDWRLEPKFDAYGEWRLFEQKPVR